MSPPWFRPQVLPFSRLWPRDGVGVRQFTAVLEMMVFLAWGAVPRAPRAMPFASAPELFAMLSLKSWSVEPESNTIALDRGPPSLPVIVSFVMTRGLAAEP